MEKISNVTVLGGGNMGSQIAFQIAYKGFNVIIYDISADMYSKVIEHLDLLKTIYLREANAAEEDIENAFNNISYSFNLSEAVRNADLTIEAVPEDPATKQQLYTELGRVAPEKTIFTTNSSTMLPSHLMEYTGRPHKFLSLHFSNLLFHCNIAEIMKSTKTDVESFDTVVEFAEAIGMVPIIVKKEQRGYILNSLLMPFMGAASELYLKGVSDVETIDKTWRIATGSPVGPFEMYDIVGLNTIYNIAVNGELKDRLFAQYIKENFLKKGKLGYLSGEGFYKYPKEEGIGRY
ncbi:MAG: 3-hydroxyacyl-CoA dehydrogenase [Dysgonomonas sp.]|jgi:3-hydroxybutyryl-CoA dehydrogenase|nr:3-hydroxyacyl-CoA dehydrogenase [Prevotella sp.]MDR3060455.1 3-hydroxyacyl-CoA dehydrogenase [Prevotella sp.]